MSRQEELAGELFEIIMKSVPMLETCFKLKHIDPSLYETAYEDFKKCYIDTIIEFKEAGPL